MGGELTIQTIEAEVTAAVSNGVADTTVGAMQVELHWQQEKLSESTRILKVLPRFEAKLNFKLLVGEWKSTEVL